MPKLELSQKMYSKSKRKLELSIVFENTDEQKAPTSSLLNTECPFCLLNYKWSVSINQYLETVRDVLFYS